MAETRIVSHPGEYKLRKAFDLLANWSSNGLVNRLLEEDIDLPSRNAAHILIGQGVDCGLLVRSGTVGAYSYALNANWRRPGDSRPANGYAVTAPHAAPVRMRAEQASAALSSPAAAYVGPAFERGTLAPHVGLRCVEGTDEDGELLPCVGGSIVDHLRGHFRAAFVEA